MRRLVERLFDGMEDTLEEIYLSNNKLGDNLSPVFSTGEFQNLKFLRVLDLSYNGIRGISENLIKGCTELKVNILFYPSYLSLLNSYLSFLSFSFKQLFILPIFLFYSGVFNNLCIHLPDLSFSILLSFLPPPLFILHPTSNFSDPVCFLSA